MAKTATVAVSRIVVHPIYGKRYKRTKKYHVHDELDVQVGDEVKFVVSKPYSKLKKWKTIEVIGKKSTKGIKSTKSIKGKSVKFV